jgi:hypothetical protein
LAPLSALVAIESSGPRLGQPVGLWLINVNKWTFAGGCPHGLRHDYKGKIVEYTSFNSSFLCH